jgi:hypothetical protein
VELPGIAAIVAERGKYFAVAAAQRPDHVVRGIAQHHVFLFGVLGKNGHADGSGALRHGANKKFLQEFSLLGKYLISVIDAVAHVYQAIVRYANAVNGRPELLVMRTIGIVGTRIGIAGQDISTIRCRR